MLLVATLLLAATPLLPTPKAVGAVTVRIENYPRPPYSGATYYIYEQAGTPICTKLEVCNKFDNCIVTYRRGAFKDPEDQETGAPYGTEPAVLIPAAKLVKHVCLAKFRPTALGSERCPQIRCHRRVSDAGSHLDIVACHRRSCFWTLANFRSWRYRDLAKGSSRRFGGADVLTLAAEGRLHGVTAPRDLSASTLRQASADRASSARRARIWLVARPVHSR